MIEQVIDILVAFGAKVDGLSSDYSTKDFVKPYLLLCKETAQAIVDLSKHKCGWTCTAIDTYRTNCGKYFNVKGMSLTERKLHKYCHYCGGEIKEKA